MPHGYNMRLCGTDPAHAHEDFACIHLGKAIKNGAVTNSLFDCRGHMKAIVQIGLGGIATGIGMFAWSAMNEDPHAYGFWGIKLIFASMVVMLVAGIGVWFAIVGHGGFQHHETREGAIKQGPLIVSIRDYSSVPGGGKVAIFSNQQSDRMTLNIRFSRSSDHKDCVLDLCPYEVKEIGWMDGWTLKRGDTITISPQSHEAITAHSQTGPKRYEPTTPASPQPTNEYYPQWAGWVSNLFLKMGTIRNIKLAFTREQLTNEHGEQVSGKPFLRHGNGPAKVTLNFTNLQSFVAAFFRIYLDDLRRSPIASDRSLIGRMESAVAATAEFSACNAKRNAAKKRLLTPEDFLVEYQGEVFARAPHIGHPHIRHPHIRHHHTGHHHTGHHHTRRHHHTDLCYAASFKPSLIKDVVSGFRCRWGNPSMDDISRVFQNKFFGDPPFIETFGHGEPFCGLKWVQARKTE